MLAPPSVIWAAATDRQLDAQFGKCRNLPCTVDPAPFDDDDESADEFDAAIACGRCPIMYACRERTLREEAASGDVWGIRGGLTAGQRRDLLTRRSAREGGPRFLPPTMSTEQTLAYLAQVHGYDIRGGTWRTKAARGTAPQALYRNITGSQWDTREVMLWGRTVANDPVLAPGVTSGGSRRNPEAAEQIPQVTAAQAA